MSESFPTFSEVGEANIRERAQREEEVDDFRWFYINRREHGE